MNINTIGGMSTVSVRDTGQTERTAVTEKSTSHPQPGKVGDELRLTSESLRLRELEDSLGTEPAIDKERVAALRQAIESGEYQVDAVKVAEKLLGFEAELSK